MKLKTVAHLVLGACITLGIGAFYSPAYAQACAPVPPPSCEIDSQFANGRWDISGITGSYDISGTEQYDADADPTQHLFEIIHDYNVVGSLEVEMVGGPEENYIDVACDGTVTGRANERLTGTLDRTMISEINVCSPDGFDTNYSWDVTIERSYRIEGEVVGAGELEVDFVVDFATFGIDGDFKFDVDCFWDEWSDQVSGFDITGTEEMETVRLSGGYDPENQSYTPTVTHQSEPWIESIARRLQLYDYPNGPDDVIPPFQLLLHEKDWPTPPLYEQLEVLAQEPLVFTPDITFESEPKTPTITDISLTEPSVYITDVMVNTRAIATVDWRDGDEPRTVEFTYAGTTESVPASGDQAIFEFDAGEAGSEIKGVPFAGGERGQPFTLRVQRATLPSWAESPSNWTGQAGISYDGMLNWPISLETTQTISDISLVSGIWGITGSASSTYNAKANSNGSPGGGDLNTSASFKFAGRGASLTMTGSNQTTLSCGELNTEGTATVTVPGAGWNATLNPLTIIPGLSAAACGLSGFLCNVINSFGIKANANAQASGTADFEASSGPFMFTGGAVTGTVSGGLSASVVPKPLDAVAQASVSGSVNGCVTIQVPPFELTAAGGSITAMASVSFLGTGSSVSHTTPFGIGCASGRGWHHAPRGGLVDAWIPADGQVRLSTLPNGVPGDLVAAAWSAPRADADRPAGDVRLRFYEAGVWESTLEITDDLTADSAPSVLLLPSGQVLLVWMRNEQTAPADASGLDDYAQSQDLAWAVVDRTTGTVSEPSSLQTIGFNFGPELLLDEDGVPHLFWQSATDLNIAGTMTAPVAIHHRALVDGIWTETDTVASGLAGVLGWRVAAFDTERQVLVMTIDGDSDLATDSDREIILFQKSGTEWDAGERLTLNTSVDDSPLAGYDLFGRPVVVWRQAGKDLVAWNFTNRTADTLYSPPDPLMDDGVDALLQKGLLVRGGPGIALLWADTHQLVLMRRLADGAWSQPEKIAPTYNAQMPHALASIGNELRAVWTEQAFDGFGGLDPLLAPRVGTFEFDPCEDAESCDRIFDDGFEQGFRVTRDGTPFELRQGSGQ